VTPAGRGGLVTDGYCRQRVLYKPGFHCQVKWPMGLHREGGFIRSILVEVSATQWPRHMLVLANR
jgi:hypothetical protein